jgi:hypothetical protein
MLSITALPPTMIEVWSLVALFRSHNNQTVVVLCWYSKQLSAGFSYILRTESALAISPVRVACVRLEKDRNDLGGLQSMDLKDTEMPTREGGCRIARKVEGAQHTTTLQRLSHFSGRLLAAVSQTSIGESRHGSLLDAKQT